MVASLNNGTGCPNVVIDVPGKGACLCSNCNPRTVTYQRTQRTEHQEAVMMAKYTGLAVVSMTLTFPLIAYEGNPIDAGKAVGLIYAVGFASGYVLSRISAAAEVFFNPKKHKKA